MSIVAAIRRLLNRRPARPLTPEEHLRRRADRLAAEARMRAEIDLAVRLWGRTNRFVR